MTYINPRNVPVPAADSADNVNIQDVAGNKQDTSFSNGATHPSITGHLKAAYYHVHDSAKVYPTGMGAITETPIVNQGGEGYAVGDEFLIVQGTNETAKFKVATETAGVVDTVEAMDTPQPGVGYEDANDVPAATVTGDGTGLTLDILTDYEYGKDPVEIAASATAWLHGAKTEVVPANVIDKMFDIHFVIASNASDADDYELRVYSGLSGSEVEIGRVSFTRNEANDTVAYVPIQVPPVPANSRISMSLACGGAVARTCEVKIYYHTYPDVT